MAFKKIRPFILRCNVDSHAVVRDNIERAYGPFAQFPLMVLSCKVMVPY